MIKHFAFALGVTTICGCMNPTFARLPDEILEKGQSRYLAVKRMAAKRVVWRERLAERKKNRELYRLKRREILAERMKMRGFPKVASIEKVNKYKSKTIDTPKLQDIANAKLFNKIGSKKKEAKFDLHLGKPNFTWTVRVTKNRGVMAFKGSKNREALAVVSQDPRRVPDLAPIKPVNLEDIKPTAVVYSPENTQSLGAGENKEPHMVALQDLHQAPDLEPIKTVTLEEKKPIAILYSPENMPSSGVGDESEPYRVTWEPQAPDLASIRPVNLEPRGSDEDGREIPQSQASQTLEVVEEPQQETFRITPILHDVNSAIHYVEETFMPTPKDEDTPRVFAEEQNSHLDQQLTPQEKPSKVDPWKNWDYAEDEDELDSSEGLTPKPEPTLEKITKEINSNSPNIVRVQGVAYAPLDSELDPRGVLTPKLKRAVEKNIRIQKINTGSPNSVRFQGVIYTPPQEVLVIPAETTRFNKLFPRLEPLVALGNALTLPDLENCRYAAGAFNTLRAKLEGTEKTSMPKDVVSELQFLHQTLQRIISGVQEPKELTPRSEGTRDASEKGVKTWLEYLWRLNMPQEDEAFQGQ